MIVGYRKDVEDVLRAAIALKKDPSITLVCGRDTKDVKAKLSQYGGDAKVMVSELVPQVPSSIRLMLRERPPAACGRRLPSLHTYIAYALRHRQCVPHELVRLLSSYYPDIGLALAHRDELSKKYFGMQMEVLREVERMRAHTRPRPAGDLMYVEISPEHHVVDLYLAWMARRVDDRASVVKAHRDYYLVNAHYLGYEQWVKEISQEEAMRLTGELGEDDNGIWRLYYDSQAIESRRNKPLAKKMLPAKYSGYSQDVRLERKKVERGIPRRCLDDFFSSRT